MLGRPLKYVSDRLLFAAGLVAGSQVPAFIVQYRQRLGGRLDQARLDLAPFQAIAERYHGGSLEALIAHHRRSNDASFRAEGDVIAALADQVRVLGEAYRALADGLFGQIAHLATHLDRNIAASTWDAFAPGVVLTPEAIVLALAAGFSASAAFNLAVFAGARGMRRLARTGRPA